MSQDRLKGSHFPKCIILQAIYWYLRYALSYRDIGFIHRKGPSGCFDHRLYIQNRDVVYGAE